MSETSTPIDYQRTSTLAFREIAQKVGKTPSQVAAENGWEPDGRPTHVRRLKYAVVRVEGTTLDLGQNRISRDGLHLQIRKVEGGIEVGDIFVPSQLIRDVAQMMVLADE